MSQGPWRNQREPGDAPLNSDRINSPDLQEAILKLLAKRAHHAWELREALLVNETRIKRELQALRKQGQAVVVGLRGPIIKRRWAIPTQTKPAKAAAGTPKKRFPRPVAERYADLLR